MRSMLIALAGLSLLLADGAHATTISPPGVQRAEVAATAGGQVAAIWNRGADAIVEARLRSPEGVWSSVVSLGHGSVVRAAAGQDGTLAIAWQHGDVVDIHTARRGDGWIGPARRMRGIGTLTAVHVRPDGAVVGIGSGGGAMRAVVVRTAQRQWSLPATSSSGSAMPTGSSSAVSGRGDIVVAWAAPPDWNIAMLPRDGSRPAFVAGGPGTGDEWFDAAAGGSTLAILSWAYDLTADPANDDLTASLTVGSEPARLARPAPALRFAPEMWRSGHGSSFSLAVGTHGDVVGSWQLEPGRGGMYAAELRPNHPAVVGRVSEPGRRVVESTSATVGRRIRALWSERDGRVVIATRTGPGTWEREVLARVAVPVTADDAGVGAFGLTAAGLRAVGWWRDGGRLVVRELPAG